MCMWGVGGGGGWGVWGGVHNHHHYHHHHHQHHFFTSNLQISVRNLRVSTTNRPVVAMGRYSQYLGVVRGTKGWYGVGDST